MTTGASTAMSRKKPSAPVRFLMRHGYIRGRVLDYGCGKGTDADAMNADGYDPEYQPDRQGLRPEYDTITCNYVLNVLPPEEREKVMEDIKRMLAPGGKAYITVRRDIDMPTMGRGNCVQFPVYLPERHSFHKTGWYEIYAFRKELGFDRLFACMS